MSSRSAFSLVELSIVLVILGLLVGGILAGQSLIRAAELRSVTAEHTRYFTAVQAFRDKYFALPGDFTKATDVWGIAAGLTGNDVTCRDFSSTTTTCNGNGDGRINSHTSSRESFRFWQHLANAGLIEGAYTGRYCGVDGLCADKTNSPGSRVNAQGVWFPYYHGTVAAGVGNMFQGEYGNVFELAGMTTANPYFPVVTPEEIWNIDTKMDDGRPGNGKLMMRAGSGGITTCTTASTDTAAAAATAEYRLTNSAMVCSFAFRQQF